MSRSANVIAALQLLMRALEDDGLVKLNTGTQQDLSTRASRAPPYVLSSVFVFVGDAFVDLCLSFLDNASYHPLRSVAS